MDDDELAAMKRWQEQQPKVMVVFANDDHIGDRSIRLASETLETQCVAVCGDRHWIGKIRNGCISLDCRFDEAGTYRLDVATMDGRPLISNITVNVLPES